MHYSEALPEDLVDIPGYEGNYKINKAGEVFSFKRSIPRRLKPTMLFQRGKPSYMVVTLTHPDGSHQPRYLHRLVAETFIGIPEGMVVNHKDLDRQNNHLDNLEVVSSSENAQHYASRTVCKNLLSYDEILHRAKTLRWGLVVTSSIPDEVYLELGVPLGYKHVAKKNHLTLIENWKRHFNLVTEIKEGKESLTDIGKKYHLSVSAMSRLANGNRSNNIKELVEEVRSLVGEDLLLPRSKVAVPSFLPLRLHESFKVMLRDWQEGMSLYGENTEALLAHLLLKKWENIRAE